MTPVYLDVDDTHDVVNLLFLYLIELLELITN